MNLTREQVIAWIVANFESRLWRTANDDYQLRLLSRFEVEAVKAALSASQPEAVDEAHPWRHALEETVRIMGEKLEAAERDATRYRLLKSRITVPYAMQSFIRHMNWHPDTFNLGIDEAIDAAMRQSAPGESK